MQFSKKDLSTVATEFSVTVPVEKIQQEVDQWLARRAATVRMDGFRKGKVPLAVVRQHYGDQAEAAAIQTVIQDAATEILNGEKITPASRPTYHVDAYDRNKGVDFTLKVEKQPEFEVKPLEALKVERICCDVTDEDVEVELKKFYDDFKKPVAVEGKVAEKGDFALVDIKATCGHKEVPELSREGIRVACADEGGDAISKAIGHGAEGKKAGDAFEVDLEMPKKFGLKACAGKHVLFAVTVREVQVMTSATFGEEEAKEYGFESLEKFKESFAQTLRRHRQNSLKICHKRAVLDSLAEQYDFEVPDSVVDVDFQGVWRFVKPEVDAARKVDDEDVRGKTDEDLEKEYRDVSVRRVRLGFVIRKIAFDNKIELTQEQVQHALAHEISRYPGEEKKVLEFYKNNPQAIERLIAPMIEDKVIDLILEKADVQDKVVTKEALEDILKEILPD